MNALKHLFDKNRNWAAEVEQSNPGFFARLAGGQSPQYLWIGCSDSRVPACQVVDLLPGDMFVHRNIANVVDLGDTSCQSVIQYAVDVLQVKHIIVCGHYGCGGVQASMGEHLPGAIGDWLQQIKNVRHKNAELLHGHGQQEQFDLLCELNVREQCKNVNDNPVVRSAREREQELHIHGWIYNLADGRLKDLEVDIA